MTRRLVVTPEAKAQLNSLYEYLAREASLGIADRYLDALLDRIAGLTDFPHRGTPRDDLRPASAPSPSAAASPSPTRSGLVKYGSSASLGQGRN